MEHDFSKDDEEVDEEPQQEQEDEEYQEGDELDEDDDMEADEEDEDQESEEEKGRRTTRKRRIVSYAEHDENEEGEQDDEEEEYDEDISKTRRTSSRYPERRRSSRDRKPPRMTYDPSVLEVRRKPKEPGFVVSAILDRAIGDTGKIVYRIRWEGFSEEDDTWEPARNLPKQIVQEFEQKWREEHPDDVEEEYDWRSRTASLSKNNNKILGEMRVSSAKRIQYMKKFRDILRLFVNEKSTKVKKSGLFNDIKDEEPEPEAVEDPMPQQPDYIKWGELKEYQMQGINWLIRQHDRGVPSILADEMGLGKTVQSITLLSFLKFDRKEEGPFLILAPLSTLEVWVSEFARWSPNMKVLLFHGNKRKREILKRDMLVFGKFDVCVTNYESLVTEKNTFKKFVWRYVVSDEAHKIKGEDTNLSSLVKSLRTQYKLLLTGTPLQNNMHELWNLLNYLFPDIFDDAEPFDSIYDPKTFSVNSDKLLKVPTLLEAFMLRRVKKDLDLPIPQKTEIKVYLPLTKLQTDVYKSLLINNASLLQTVKQKDMMMLLNLILQLRKCCNHPYLLMGYPEDSDLQEFTKASAKLNFMDKLFPRMQKSGSRVLIYSQWTQTLDFIEEYMNEAGYSYLRLDGSTHQVERQFSIQRFNTDHKIFAFLISTKAGGLGINLATADTVILNPQADLQAQARAHRLGQTKPVKVYRLLCEGTVEERVMDISDRKLLLSSVVIKDNDEQSELKGFSASELLNLIKFGAGTIFSSKGRDLTDEDIDAIVAKADPEKSANGQSNGHSHVKEEEKESKLQDVEFDFSKLSSEVIPIRLFQGKKYETVVEKPDDISKEMAAPKEVTTFTEGMKVVKLNARPWTHEKHCFGCMKSGKIDKQCQWCPKVYHSSCAANYKCAELLKTSAWGCPWHMCANCGKSSEAGYFFRCESCPTTYCFDCLPEKYDVVGKVSKLVTRLFTPRNVMYIHCPSCVNSSRKKTLVKIKKEEEADMDDVPALTE